MAQRHGRVDVLTRQQQSDRTADGHSPANYAHIRAVEFHAVAFQQLNDGARRTRKGRGDVTFCAQHQAAQVHRMQAVSVLIRIDVLQHGLGIDPDG